MHALVVGGTGILKEVVYYLAKQEYIVSVIALHPESLDKLNADASFYAEKVHGWALDYHDTNALENMLLEAINKYGPITLTIAWIHSTDIEAPLAVAKQTQQDFFHIRSASAAKPNYQDPFDISAIQALPQIHYHRIILGSMIGESGESRWLTNDEIAKGIIRSLQTRERENIVGTIM